MKEIFGALADELSALLRKLWIAFLGGENHQLTGRFDKKRSFLQRHENGFGIGNHYTNLKQSYQHLMTIAPSGSGKTVSVIIPTLTREKPVSFVVNDNSGELSELLIPYFKSIGYKTVVLDFAQEQFFSNSFFFNPIEHLKSRSDVAKFSALLTKYSKQEGYWKLKSEELLTLSILIIQNETSKFHNLANVLYFLQLLAGQRERVNRYMVKQTEEIYRMYRTLMAGSSDTVSSIISSALSCLSFISNNPMLSFLTSKDNMPSLELMRNEKVVIFLKTPISDQSVYSVIVSSYLEGFFSKVLRSPLPKEEELGIHVIADELGSMHVPGLSNYFSNLRKWRCGILGVLQSENQLIDIYGQQKAKTILNNCSKVYMTGLTDESKDIAELLGEYEYQDQNYRKKRKLRTHDEVRSMSPNKVIVVPNSGGLRPIELTIKPYYKQSSILKKINVELEENEEEVTEIPMQIEYFVIPELPEEEGGDDA